MKTSEVENMYAQSQQVDHLKKNYSCEKYNQNLE